MASSPPRIPIDIIQHILANLSIKEIYILRRVSREWYSIFEHALMEHMITHNSQVLVRVGQKPTASLSLALDCVEYCPKTGVYTFRPVIEGEDGKGKESQFICERRNLRQVKILFGEWIGVNKSLHNNNIHNNNSDIEDPIFAELNTGSLGPLGEDSRTADALALYANIKFHSDYIEAVSKEYHLKEGSEPSSSSKSTSYIGDYDMICKINLESLKDEESPDSNNLVSFKVDFVKVRSSWIFSGLSTHSPMPSYKIYESRYSMLDQLLGQEHSYNRYASRVLEWITSDAGVNDELTRQLIEHLRATDGDFDTCALLARALEAKGVTRNHMWKFGIVKRYLADPEGSSTTFEQIVEKVVLTEKSGNSSNNSNNIIRGKKNATSGSRVFNWNFGRFS
ncbi:4978_t:CDS:1 [Ambispora gerdemannii]|uniref:4978_t:CDS:1 n=1 Tax=Ambispora gerdemannii TaxID=144530 RepID=A0A9N8ZGX9_9GLOM|nr:4978_t:CDS:1 [Ambispora gerdemannii]